MGGGGGVDIPDPVFHWADAIPPPVDDMGDAAPASVRNAVLLEHTGGSVAEYAAVHAAGGSIQPALEQQERRGLAEDFVRDKSALKTTRILRQPVQKGTDAGSRRRIKPSAAHESTGEACLLYTSPSPRD